MRKTFHLFLFYSGRILFKEDNMVSYIKVGEKNQIELLKLDIM